MNERRRGNLLGGVALLALASMAGVAAGQEVRVRQIGRVGQANYSYLAIPGLYMLGNEDVQKELELVEDQKTKLREIGKKYQEQMRGAWAGVRDLPADQRAAKYQEIREKTRKMGEEARNQAREVLLAHQVDRLKKMIVRTRAQYSLQNPRLQQDIGLDEKQQKQLADLRTELQQRMKELNEEMLDKALKVLTPQQSKKLEDTTWKSLNQGYGYGYGGAPVVRQQKAVPLRKNTE